MSVADAAVQSQAWSELGLKLISTERIGNGVAMTFPSGLASSVADLAAREAECCGFLSVRTSQTDQTVRLEITSDNPDHHPMIEGLVGMIRGQ